MHGSVLLKGWREAREQTQKEGAKSLGVSQGALSEYENGKAPRLDVALKLARLTSGAVPVESWERLEEATEGAPDLASPMENAPGEAPAASGSAISATASKTGSRKASRNEADRGAA